MKNREHDFSSKLKQASVIERLKQYIAWQRSLIKDPAARELPSFAPVSINLDLTSLCNFGCPHCVDSMIINGESLRLDKIRKTLDVLSSGGLLSVILLGGGEPTLHRDFGEIVRTLKEKRLELGIVTNGSRLERVSGVAGLLEKKDWIRISIDAARGETFEEIHRPRTRVRLGQILEKARQVKEENPAVSLGYSFVIVWEGLEINGARLTPNIEEIAESVEMAREHSFDYVSFKPCLVRLEKSQREALLHNGIADGVVDRIKAGIERGKAIGGEEVKVLESVNLKAMLSGEVERIKKQPGRCHMQFFRTVVSPSGIFHCPAFRGVAKAKIAEKDGYSTEAKFKQSLKCTAESVLTFEAEEECKLVGCFYNETNWWLENLIRSGKDLNEIERLEDDNFFL
jgi:MoaA/NifB/PqqE/SkfB family radical SAM enzyme